jgi:hypothetical protein
MPGKAIIFHGTGGNPEVCWYPWLGRRLAGRGYPVEIPHYPGLNVEPTATFLPKVLANYARRSCATTGTSATTTSRTTPSNCSTG